MRFASVMHDGQPLAVAIDGDRATPMRGVTEIGRETPASLLREPPLGDGSLPLGDLRFRPVVPNPAKVLCIGLNYLAHTLETQRDESDYPVRGGSAPPGARQRPRRGSRDHRGGR